MLNSPCVVMKHKRAGNPWSGNLGAQWAKEGEKPSINIPHIASHHKMKKPSQREAKNFASGYTASYFQCENLMEPQSPCLYLVLSTQHSPWQRENIQ